MSGSWGIKRYSSTILKAISFVLYPSALELSVNFDKSKLANRSKGEVTSLDEISGSLI